MARPEQRVPGLVEQMVQVDTAVEISEAVGLVGRRDERHVELAGGEHRDRLLGLGLEHRERNVGVPSAERGHGGGHQRGAGGREGRHPDAAAAQAGDRLKLALGDRLLGDNRVGVTEQRLAGVGESDPAGRAIEQRHAGAALECRHLLGDRRLRVGECLGGGRERAEPGDLAEDLQVAQLKHKLSLELSQHIPI